MSTSHLLHRIQQNWRLVQQVMRSMLFNLQNRHSNLERSPPRCNQDQDKTVIIVLQEKLTGESLLEVMTKKDNGCDDVQTNRENNYPELVPPKPTKIVSRPSSKQDRQHVYQPLTSQNSTELATSPASNEEYVVQPSESPFQLGEKTTSVQPGSA